MTMRSVYYTGAGETLVTWQIDVDGAALAQRSAVTLPAPAMYGWPDNAREHFYMVCSDGGPYPENKHHYATAWKLAANGDLAPHGEPLTLPARPIHASLDRAGKHLLIAYNMPSMFTVHRIEGDGRIGGQVEQTASEFGLYGHQILATPNDNGVLFVCRGTDAGRTRPEDPGSLHTFAYDDGRLTHRRTIALGDNGLGFGARHLDFHPSGRFITLCVERQSRLMVFGLSQDGDLTPEPLHDVGTLSRPSNGRQAAGFIRMHPSGRFVYLSNRSFGWLDDGQRVADDSESDLVAFALDPETGAPSLLQHVDPGLFHIRNAGIDPSGRLLVCTSIEPARMPDGSIKPAMLAALRIGDDGRLTPANNYPVDVGRRQIFWSGMVDLR
ncbi:MAG: beta-propeller fold lactonase family protein [Alphaproteobacteria bacterium]